MLAIHTAEDAEHLPINKWTQPTCKTAACSHNVRFMFSLVLYVAENVYLSLAPPTMCICLAVHCPRLLPTRPLSITSLLTSPVSHLTRWSHPFSLRRRQTHKHPPPRRSTD